MKLGELDAGRRLLLQIGIGFCILVLIILITILVFPPTNFAPSNEDSPVKVRILAVNDFHGQISAGKRLNTISAGGAPVLASYLRDSMNRQDVSATFLALPGDLIGASPPDSGLLLDEPTILLFNTFADGCRNGNITSSESKCGVIATLGNHEFDQDIPELIRLLSGGNGSTTIPHISDPYPGPNFTYVCSNVVWTANNTPFVPPYVIRNVSGIPVAFIGADTMETTSLSLPEDIVGISFLNETESINRYVKEVQGRGVHAIIIVLHEGGTGDTYEGPTRTGTNVTGRVTGIVAGLDPDVDIVLAGHTHNFVNAYLNNSGGKPVLVTEAYNYSVAFADVTFTLDQKTGDITENPQRL